MASPLLLVRAVSGIAMPLALGAAYIQRRHARRDRRPGPATSPPSLTRVDHRELRQRLERGADLTGVDLTGARLDRIDLRGRRLTDMDLSWASLRNSLLSGCDLTGTHLDHADLSGADLRGADLTGASLLETTLCGADLSGADLASSRQVVMAGLRRARFDGTTRWPPGFDPLSAGAERKRTHHTSSPA
jgi:hypothetical protein